MEQYVLAVTNWPIRMFSTDLFSDLHSMKLFSFTEINNFKALLSIKREDKMHNQYYLDLKDLSTAQKRRPCTELNQTRLM
jgi:hypothetical protein